METNPYAPSFADESMQENPELQPDELAGRFTRLASAFIDGLTMLVFIMPAMFLTGYLQRVGPIQGLTSRSLWTYNMFCKFAKELKKPFVVTIDGYCVDMGQENTACFESLAAKLVTGAIT